MPRIHRPGTTYWNVPCHGQEAPSRPVPQAPVRYTQPYKRMRYPWESPRRTGMSLVMGFSVQDGILMCSDTQYTGAGKVFQQKLFQYFQSALGTSTTSLDLAGMRITRRWLWMSASMLSRTLPLRNALPEEFERPFVRLPNRYVMSTFYPDRLMKEEPLSLSYS
jgi:hypothetical protein